MTKTIADLSQIEHINIKSTKKARKLLKQIAAITEEHQYAVLERVLDKELIVVRKKSA
jgi:hypothetical protein